MPAHQWYAEYLAALGRHDQALAEIKRAQQLDPLAVPVNRAVGWVLYFGRRYDHSSEELQKALPMDAEFLGARLVLWWVQVAEGAAQQAIADIRKEIERPLARSAAIRSEIRGAGGAVGGGVTRRRGGAASSHAPAPWLASRSAIAHV